MNLNDLARRITLKDGGKKHISVAQVKEVMKMLLEELAELDDKELQRALARYSWFKRRP